jgi:hypothetical protein
MGVWGSEQQLLRFGKEGEEIFGEKGCRRPKRNFVDVLSDAGQK